MRTVYDARVPRIGNTSRLFDAALGGELNWRSGGGFECGASSPLQAVALYLHYGVSS